MPYTLIELLFSGNKDTPYKVILLEDGFKPQCIYEWMRRTGRPLLIKLVGNMYKANRIIDWL